MEVWAIKSIEDIKLEQLQLITTDLTDLLPKVIVDRIYEVGRRERVMRQVSLVDRQLVGKAGRSVWYLKRNADFTVKDVTENSDITTGAQSEATHTTVEISVASSKKGAWLRISQEAIDASQFNVIQGQIDEAGQAFADKEDKDIFAAFSSTYDDTTDATAAGTTATDLYNAILSVFTKLRVNKKDKPRFIVMGFRGVEKLMQGGSPFILASGINPNEASMALNGFVGRLLATPVLTTQTVDDLTTATTAGPKVLVIDPGNASAPSVALVIKRDIDLKRRDAPFADRIELFWYTEYKAAKVYRDGFGQVFIGI